MELDQALAAIGVSRQDLDADVYAQLAGASCEHEIAEDRPVLEDRQG